MFQLDGWKIGFHHDRAEGMTLCTLDNDVTHVVGVAFCSHKDQFSYAAGRKVALAKALKILTADKSLRLKFWLAYKATGAKGSEYIQDNSHGNESAVAVQSS